jgi:antitoxin CptB
MAKLDRIRWHCRRGLLELDIVLGRFNDRHLEALSVEDLKTFETLLEEADNDLFDLVMGRAEPVDERHRKVVEMLRVA